MDEFGSPIAGGISAVRRNISSSFFSGGQQQKPDTVTTNLLQQQSLQLTSVSQQLQTISNQISTFDRNLNGVKENLALTEQLEKQREGARQNRERILAEQGLREGKESALEAKIQSSLTQPLQRIGIKTQSTLGSLSGFLLTLAGGWLTVTGIDLLQSLSEGNVDKINALKVRFLGGLTIIAGSLTAISIGIKKTLAILGGFAGLVGRVAFGGFLRAGLKGVQVLLAGLVKKAAGIGVGIFGGGLGAILTEIGGYFAFNRISKFLGGIFKKSKITSKVTSNLSKTNFTKLPPTSSSKNILQQGRNIFKKLGGSTDKVTSSTSLPPSTKIGLGTKVKRFFVGQGKDVGAMANPTKTGGLLGRAKGLVTRGKNLVDDGVKAVGKKGILGKLGNLTKGLPKMGIGKLLGKVFGPLITFFSELTSEDGGLASALAATAGFMAGAKVGAAAGAAIGAFFGGVGAGPGAFIGGLIGGLAGETLMKSIVKKIMGALGLKDIKVFGNKDKKETEGQKTIEVDGKLLSEKDYSKEDIELLNSGSAKLDASGNIVPIKSNNGNAAEQISSFEDKPEVVTVDMGGATNGQSGGVNASGVSMKEGDSLPNIGFDDNNPHTIYATATTGAG